RPLLDGDAATSPTQSGAGLDRLCHAGGSGRERARFCIVVGARPAAGADPRSLSFAIGEVQPAMSKILIQEPDRIPSRKVIVIGVSALIAFAIGVGASAAFLAHRGVVKPLPPATSEIGRPQIGIVYQTPFQQLDLAARREPQKRRLRGYGWVDRKR